MKYLVLFCAVFFLSVQFSRAADPMPADHDFFFGIELNPAASDHARNLFFETGMNCVRMTGGGFGWSVAGHKKLADDFQARGLKVYMQLGSHYPDGSYFDLTSSYMVDQNGVAGVPDKKSAAITYEDEHWPQYSYTSQPFKDRLTKDFTSYVGNFADDHNIAGVILHNEAGFFWINDRLYDYNPITIAAFRHWLSQQDRGIATLNARWGTTYTSFDEVKPPTSLPPESNIASWMDWRHFSMESVADFMKWEADLYHTLRPDVPRTTNLDGPLNNWYGYKMANMLEYSAGMDRVGVDLYPADWSSRTFLPYSTDMVQGVAQGREGNVLECNAFVPGEWKPFDEETRAGLLRSELWTLFGHGMSGVLIWGFDTFNDPNDPFNARVRTCRDIAHQTAMIGMKDFHRQKSRVAECIDPDSYLYVTALETKPFSLSSTLDHEYQGIHAALADAGVQTDVIFAQQLAAGVAKNYDVIIMPSAIMMDETTSTALKDFVSNGGTLVASAPFATMDRWGKKLDAVPAFGLDEVFGCTVSGSHGDGNINAPQGSVFASTAVKLTPKGASIVATFSDGAPGITSNTFGKGRAIFIAGKVGFPFLDGWAKPDAVPGMLDDIFKQASVVRQTEGESPGQVDISTLADSRGNVLLVASVSTQLGKLTPPVMKANILYRADDAASFREGFAFPATTTDGGVVRSGPVPVTLTAKPDDKSVSFQLDKIDSATPLLLTRDAGPLVATEAPSSVVNGQEEDITVTCYNPSANPVQGELTVRAGSSVTFGAGAAAPVTIPAYGQQEEIIKAKVKASGAVSRVPVTVVLTPTGASEIKGVPVDITVR